jgi:hypothetical protein
MATDYAAAAIFTQADMELAAILGRKFGYITAVDIVRNLSDIDISKPYDAETATKVHERLQRYGYSANEVQDALWAIRERGAWMERNHALVTLRQQTIGGKPLTRYEREIMDDKEPQ